MADEAPLLERPLRLKEDVAHVRTQNGRILLVSSSDAPAVQISRVGGELIPLLVEGADRDTLADYLRQKFPQARDVDEKLQAFLQKLASAGLLEGADPQRPRPGRIKLVNPDAPAHMLVRLCSRLPRAFLRWCFAIAVAGAGAGIGTMIAMGLQPYPEDLVTGFDAWGLAAFLFIWLPLHEFSHALGCRAAGVPVTGAGIILRGRTLPGLYVDTRNAFLITDRWRRFWISFAGPLADFLLCGLCAWLVAIFPADHTLGESAKYTLVVGGYFLYFNLNPFRTSDGSHMLEAYLEDDLARHSAFSRRPSPLSTRRAIRIYRVAAILHFAVGIAVVIATLFRLRSLS